MTPRVENTDRDFLILTNNLDKFTRMLSSKEWELHEDYTTGNSIKFVCARKGINNLIVYEDVEGFTLFKAATRALTLLNYQDKNDRVALFRRICGEDQELDDGF